MKREKRCPYFLKGRLIHVPADAVIREAQVFSGIIRGVKGVQMDKKKIQSIIEDFGISKVMVEYNNIRENIKGEGRNLGKY